MSELKGETGELRATIQITRKATGKTETYELIASGVTEEQAQALGAEITKPEGE